MTLFFGSIFFSHGIQYAKHIVQTEKLLEIKLLNALLAKSIHTDLPNDQTMRSIFFRTSKMAINQVCSIKIEKKETRIESVRVCVCVCFARVPLCSFCPSSLQIIRKWLTKPHRNTSLLSIHQRIYFAL